MNRLTRTKLIWHGDFPKSLTPATVMHANKYYKATNSSINHLIRSSLHIDAAFRVKELGEDIRLLLIDMDIPIYTGEEILVMYTAGIPVAYVDVKTNEYYYLSNNFCRMYGIGFPYVMVWAAGLAAAWLIYQFVTQQNPVLLITPPATIWILYMIQKWVINWRVRKLIDGFMEG